MQEKNFPATRSPCLYLIPAALGDVPADAYWPLKNIEVVRPIRCFIAENERSARRFLRKAGFTAPFGQVTFHILNKHSKKEDIPGFLQAADEGQDIGLLSEAGCPGVADPGQQVVRMAHERGLRVVPLVGPSSILLGLMASGFNGQQFVFHGYLPIQKTERARKIREMERDAQRKDQTQVFMEAPFRNNQLLADLAENCQGSTLLCVASDLSLPGETILTKDISWWRKNRPDRHKRPSIFLLYTGMQ
jgi:16S rRNA (cytidine1402-2'-O)-methyltransferase